MAYHDILGAQNVLDAYNKYARRTGGDRREGEPEPLVSGPGFDALELPEEVLDRLFGEGIDLPAGYDLDDVTSAIAKGERIPVVLFEFLINLDSG